MLGASGGWHTNILHVFIEVPADVVQWFGRSSSLQLALHRNCSSGYSICCLMVGVRSRGILECGSMHARSYHRN